MKFNYSLGDLAEWDQRILALAEQCGLRCFSQEFQLCDHEQMISYLAYSGAPSHYPHWSYGKAFERTETSYRYGITSLPYEMVINSDPALAYLMKDNSLALQLLTIAHVYGHNDFFKNNHFFKLTNPGNTLIRFKTHAQRVRRYVESPGIGLDKVEKVLDAAHALSWQRRRNPDFPQLTLEDQRQRIFEKYYDQPADPYRQLTVPEPVDEEKMQRELQKVPLESDENLLLFIRDYNRHLSEWEKDLLTIADEEAEYFIPQIDTKIMNEGWASYWHHRIMLALDLDQDMRWEFMGHHSRVLRPHSSFTPNPYRVGWTIWNAIRIFYDGMVNLDLLDKSRPEEINLFEEMKNDFKRRNAFPGDTGKIRGEQKLFEIREGMRDTSFLDCFLTPPLLQSLDLYQWKEVSGADGNDYQITTDEEWQTVTRELIKQTGMNNFPVIKVEDANYGNLGHLLIKHYHEGRDLEQEQMARSLAYVRQLWGGKVTLETVIDDKPAQCHIDGSGKLIINQAKKK